MELNNETNEHPFIEKLEGQIENIDKEILYLIKRRFQTSKKIVQYKKDNNLELGELDFNTIIFKRVKDALTMNLREKFVRELFEIILEENQKLDIEVYEK